MNAVESLVAGFGRDVGRFPAALVAVCLALLGVSLLLLQSASLLPGGGAGPYLARQLVWVGAGLTAFLVVSLVPYPWVGRRGAVIYVLGVLALLLVFVVGTKVNGARRWFSFGPVRVQPSEFMKYALVVVLARSLARQGPRVKTWRGLAEAGALTGLPFCLVLLQPDLGTSLTYLPILFALVFAAGARPAHLGLIGLAGLISAPLAWLFVLRDYQKDRILNFIDGSDTLGGAYQTHQSVIAIGSGGMLGKGYMQGTQGPLGFLPERHTDFIFGVVGEDFGLVGCVLLLVLYGVLLTALLQVAEQTRDMEGRLIAVGVAAITLTQVTVNVGMALGVAPVTGLTLPLVSYGGSSLVASMLGFGLVASVASHRRLVFSG